MGEPQRIPVTGVGIVGATRPIPPAPAFLPVISADRLIDVKFEGRFESVADLVAAVRSLADEYEATSGVDDEQPDDDAESPVTFAEVGYAMGALLGDPPDAECACEVDCDVVIDLDGLGATFGAEVAAYYTALTAGGVTQDEAEYLIADLHDKLWTIALGLGDDD